MRPDATPPLATFETATNRADPPNWERRIKAHRSLSNQGFVITFLVATGASLLPLLAFLGTLALWVLLPYLAAAILALWYFIRRNDRDGTLSEHIRIWPDLIAVHRHNPRAPDQFWLANPYWVSLHLQNRKDMQHYLTVKGAGREIELGAFLTPEGRQDLHRDLELALRQNAIQSPE